MVSIAARSCASVRPAEVNWYELDSVDPTDARNALAHETLRGRP
jgi:hypothetical protein